MSLTARVLDLSLLTASQGFIIQGDAEQDHAGYSVASAGDVNGDGIDHLIVGGRLGDDAGLTASEVYAISRRAEVKRANRDLGHLTTSRVSSRVTISTRPVPGQGLPQLGI